MTTTFDEFTSATTALAVINDVLTGLSEPDMHLSTPCPDYDVTALLHHLTDTIARLGAAAGIDTTDDPDSTPSEHLRAVAEDVIPVPVAPTASTLDQLIAFTGRNPIQSEEQ